MKVPLLTVLLVTSSLGVSFSARGVGEQTRPAPREDKDGRATWILQQRTGPTGRLPVESLRRTAERRALAAAFGREPVIVGEGGSIPVVGDFERVLKAPVLLGSKRTSRTAPASGAPLVALTLRKVSVAGMT